MMPARSPIPSPFESLTADIERLDQPPILLASSDGFLTASRIDLVHNTVLPPWLRDFGHPFKENS